MNYQRIYEAIVTRFRYLSRKEAKERFEYVETHHIIPKSLGGSDSEENLIHVPARVHYLLHYLLVKIHPNSSSMWYAFHFMRNSSRDHSKGFRISAGQYELIRKNLARLGRSDELKAKVSATLTGRKLGPHSAEHRANQSKAMKGIKKTFTPESLENIKRLRSRPTGRIWTDEMKAEISIKIREGKAKAKALRNGEPTEKMKEYNSKPRLPYGPQSEETIQRKRDAWVKRKETGVSNGQLGLKRGPYKKKSV